METTGAAINSFSLSLVICTRSILQRREFYINSFWIRLRVHRKPILTHTVILSSEYRGHQRLRGIFAAYGWHISVRYCYFIFKFRKCTNSKELASPNAMEHFFFLARLWSCAIRRKLIRYLYLIYFWTRILARVCALSLFLVHIHSTCSANFCGARILPLAHSAASVCCTAVPSRIHRLDRTFFQLLQLAVYALRAHIAIVGLGRRQWQQPWDIKWKRNFHWLNIDVNKESA